MKGSPENYTVFADFKFERPPIGVKFLLNKPDGIDRLEKKLALCEMIREAQERAPFYVSADNFACLGSLVLGMREPEPIVVGGEIGAREGIYQEARANKRIYQYVAKLPPGTVRYVCFASLDRLPFDPDIIIVMPDIRQAEILFRAYSYSTGRMLSAKSTPVIMCSWLIAYPYLSGEMNYTITGLGSGMKARKVFSEGLMMVSIPFDILPMMTRNLENMQWELPLHHIPDEDKDYFTRTSEEIRQEYLRS